MTEMTKRIEAQLFAFQDEEYRRFQAKLMPGISLDLVIGVRTPLLRKLAKELAKQEKIDDFLSDLPHSYYDENNLHGFIISECRDYRKTMDYLNAFLPYVDNWATCDLLSPRAFLKNHTALAADIPCWLASDKPFTIRFGIEMIMSHFLDDDFDDAWLARVAKLRSTEYYVNMMIAWFFATALAKQWDAAFPWIEAGALDHWTHNKAIQKALESYRISDEKKAILRSLKK